MVGNLKSHQRLCFFNKPPTCGFTQFSFDSPRSTLRIVFYTNKESAKAVAKLMDEEEAKEAAEEAEKAGGSVGYHILGHRFLTWKRP